MGSDPQNLDFQATTEEELQAVLSALSAENESAEYMRRYAPQLATDLISFCKSGNRYPVGLHRHLVQELSAAGIEVLERIKPNFREFVNGEVDQTRLDEHQVQAVLASLNDPLRRGIIKIPTRGGKTRTAAEIIRVLKNRHNLLQVVFMVDTKDLLAQAVKELSAYLGEDVGAVGDGEVNVKKVTVAMVQTVQRIKVSKMSQMSPNRRYVARAVLQMCMDADVLVVDEVHEYTSHQRRQMLGKFKNLRRIIGLSATPFSGDRLRDMRLQQFAGGVVYEIPESDLIKSGRLSDYRVALLIVNHQTERRYDYRAMMTKYIHRNSHRSDVLADVIGIARHLKVKTLVLFTDIAHMEREAHRNSVPCLSGKDDQAERERIKQDFLEGEGKVLFASGIFKKGITLPEAELLVNAAGGLSAQSVRQKKGRVLGSTGQKNRAMVIDLCDMVDLTYDAKMRYIQTRRKQPEHFHLDVHVGERIKVYETDVGEDNLRFYDTDDDNWRTDLAKHMQTWLRKSS